MSEGGRVLADGVVLRPGERDRNDAGDDVVERRRGAVSAGSWYVRADNAIRMGGGGGVCTGGQVPWNAVWEPNTRVVAGAAGCRALGRSTAAASVAASRAEGWMAASIFTLYRRRGVRLYTDDSSGGRVEVLREVAGARPGLQNKAGTSGSRSVLGGRSACAHGRCESLAFPPPASTRVCATVQRRLRLRAHRCRRRSAARPFGAIVCRCLYHLHPPGCYILTLDVVRRYRSAALRYAPRKRLANVCETALVVFHLRIPVLRRLCVPHGLPAAPCSMSTSKPLLNSPRARTLAATALISALRSLPYLRATMYRAITDALPHHLSWESHAQATQCTSSTQAAFPSFLIYHSAARRCLCARLPSSVLTPPMPLPHVRLVNSSTRRPVLQTTLEPTCQ